jgi:hypothetical protein
LIELSRIKGGGETKRYNLGLGWGGGGSCGDFKYRNPSAKVKTEGLFQRIEPIS